MRIAALMRFPVKGLSPEPLESAELPAGGFFPGDRLYAIENGPSGFDPAAPAWIAKIRYLMLMRDEKLATLRTRYDDAASTLHVSLHGREVAAGDLSTAQGRAAVEAFFAEFCKDNLRGPPRVLPAPQGYRFTDSSKGFVSLINAGSVRDLEGKLGRDIDWRRFRGNILVEGLPAWDEFHLVSKTLSIGEARLSVIKPIERCAATNVDPESGARDMQIPRSLMKLYGHVDCGIYARIEQGGRIAVGDAIGVAA